MEKLHEVKELRHKLIEDLVHDIEQCGIEGIDVDVAGKQVDMIKDLAETEEKCAKAHYYAEVVEAMDDAEERSGYDRYRKANGQYATKGTGTRMRGYTPTYEHDMIMQPMMHIPYEARMGYPSSQTGRTHTYNTNSNAMPAMPKYYHESEGHMDPEYHVDEMVDTMRDIWSDATHDQKKKIKSELSALLAEMAL